MENVKKISISWVGGASQRGFSETELGSSASNRTTLVRSLLGRVDDQEQDLNIDQATAALDRMIGSTRSLLFSSFLFLLPLVFCPLHLLDSRIWSTPNRIDGY